MLRKLKAATDGDHVFMSERGTPLGKPGLGKMMERLGRDAGLSELKIHPHMFRHACGYALANKGVDTRTLQEYMGHAQINNTVRYTVLNASRFKTLWDR